MAPSRYRVPTPENPVTPPVGVTAISSITAPTIGVFRSMSVAVLEQMEGRLLLIVNVGLGITVTVVDLLMGSAHPTA